MKIRKKPKKTWKEEKVKKKGRRKKEKIKEQG